MILGSGVYSVSLSQMVSNASSSSVLSSLLLSISWATFAAPTCFDVGVAEAFCYDAFA